MTFEHALIDNSGGHLVSIGAFHEFDSNAIGYKTIAELFPVRLCIGDSA